MRQIKLAQDTITKEDIVALTEWLLQDPTPQLTKGKLTEEFERKYAEKVGCKYAVLVNSGSSANLLMTYALSGKKIVIPTLSWITTISPAIQFGMTPILCDCNLNDLSVDINHLEEIFKKDKPEYLFLVNVLGLSADMDSVIMLCENYNVLLIIDNCEGTGSKYKGKYVEQYGFMTSTSLYYGHIITSGTEGGVITTNSYSQYNYLKMYRSHGWDRDLDKEAKAYLKEQVGGISDFNSLYTFYTLGFNLRSTDINAFLALRQLDILDKVSMARDSNFFLYKSLIKNNLLTLDVKDRFVSNLGFPVVHQNRDAIVKSLQENGVEVRPLISGSMGTQPFWKKQYGECILPNASIIDRFGMYVPNTPAVTEEDIKLIADIVNNTK